MRDPAQVAHTFQTFYGLSLPTNNVHLECQKLQINKDVQKRRNFFHILLSGKFFLH